MTHRNLVLRCVLDCMDPFSKITQKLTSYLPFGTVPQSSLRGYLLVLILSKSPNKIEIHLSHVVHFYFSRQH